MIDDIIKWSGWFIALSWFGWEIFKYVRNRYKVIINVSLEPRMEAREAKENIVVIEASNFGRRPVNLTFAGLFCKKESILSSDEIPIKVGWVYKKLPRHTFINPEVLKDIVFSLKENYNIEADGIGFLDESGDKHIGYFPENLRQFLYN